MYRILFYGLACCLLGGLSLQVQAQEDAYCEALYEFVEVLEEKHVAPPSYDTTWASGFSKLFVQSLDPHSLYFLTEDIRKIQSLEKVLLEDLKDKRCEYVREFSQLFWARLKKVNQVLTKLEQTPFQYPQSDTLIWRPGSDLIFPRVSSLEELRYHWEKYLKYQILVRAFGQKNETSLAQFKKAAFDLQLQQLENEHCELEQIMQFSDGFEAYLMREFMDALSASFDPHSGYYSLSEKELWDLALSTESYSFGLEFERNRQGILQVSRLNPGGPAWRSRELHIGDEILEIEYPKGQKLDIACLSIQDLVDELRSSLSDQMYLLIKKQNGEIRSLHLEKEKIQQEENVINSYLLNGERKIGYIYLPAFYTESEDESTAGCADDIARELLRLQSEQIEGLILDLRYNGGGSMKEALSLAGIFIDRGPLAIYEERGKDATLLRDMNRGSIYQGPLVLLINGLSASASEILASALQDYDRAIVVGSQSFGKSSGQIMLPIVGSGLGVAKISIQKYYRINGKSYQLKGVRPDIPLPNIDQVIGRKERDYLYPLTHSVIERQTLYKKSGAIPYKYLREKSLGRIIKHPRFRELENLIEELEQLQAQGMKIILTPKRFQESLEKQLLLIQTKETLTGTPSDKYQLEDNRFMESLLQLDPRLISWNQAQKQKIHQDLYIEEAFFILSDLIRKTNP